MERNIEINNAIGILKELLHNGDSGNVRLYVWFRAERELIVSTLEDLEAYELETI